MVVAIVENIKTNWHVYSENRVKERSEMIRELE